MKSLGDFDASTVIYDKFTTYRPSTGATYTLGGTPALSVYKDNSTTQSTSGVTLTVDFDSVTGLNHYAIDTSSDGTFYSAGSFFSVVITTGTVDSVSVTGTVVGCFTLRKTSALKPTTAARTLDVSAGGEAGIDWANIGSPTTAVNLSATNIDTDQVIATATAVTTVNGLAAGVITAASIAADAITAAKIADGAIDAATFAANAITSTVIANDAITAAKIATNAIDADALSADAVTEIQSGLATAAALATVGGYIDTEIATLQATADAILVDTAEIGAAGAGLTALASQASVDDLPTNAELATALASADDAVLAQVALVKAKTDSLTFTVANQLDANIQSINDVTIVGDGSGTPFNV